MEILTVIMIIASIVVTILLYLTHVMLDRILDNTLKVIKVNEQALEENNKLRDYLKEIIVVVENTTNKVEQSDSKYYSVIRLLEKELHILDIQTKRSIDIRKEVRAICDKLHINLDNNKDGNTNSNTNDEVKVVKSFSYDTEYLNEQRSQVELDNTKDEER